MSQSIDARGAAGRGGLRGAKSRRNLSRKWGKTPQQKSPWVLVGGGVRHGASCRRIDRGIVGPRATVELGDDVMTAWFDNSADEVEEETGISAHACLWFGSFTLSLESLSSSCP